MNREHEKKASLNADAPAQDWHPADVTAALHKSGWSMHKLARHHGLTTSGTFSKALRSSYPIAERRIADALGIHPKEIWPSRYYENGEPKPRGYRAFYYSPSGDSVNGKENAGNRHEGA
ncbi:helix-turn-helix domain-containing protein [Methylomicrobium lacus]|uniref:helix-turn-helix domain-containing protein n=1 Tax=Methylomicrobium lacus TaxID=136992 RepID=UPI0009FCDC1D|nr:helix-turn-helix transcriptional regulator [Methylomicrobium lacus]